MSSSSSANLTALKDRLFELGVSTATPGMGGVERVEELKRRLQIAEASLSASNLDGLTMGEIRSRLTDLGESTSTPGIIGDERRAELIRRLGHALCSSDEKAHNPFTAPSVPHKEPSRPSNSPHTPEPEPVSASPPKVTVSLRPPSDYINDFAHVLPPALLQSNADMARYESMSVADLHLELDRVRQQRAAVVSARSSSGPDQDPRLRECVKLITKIGTESARLKELRRTSRFGSSVLVNGGAVMSIESHLEALETLRSDVRQRGRGVKALIREEEDASLEHGVAVEQKLRAAAEMRRQDRKVRSVVVEKIRAEGADNTEGGDDIEGGFNTEGFARLLSSVDDIFHRVGVIKENVGEVEETAENDDGPTAATMGRSILGDEVDDDDDEIEDDNDEIEDDNDDDDDDRGDEDDRDDEDDKDGQRDLRAAEAMHLRALDLDPMDVVTLRNYAVFLHRSRGEMQRAESFFRRALQICLPSVLQTINRIDAPIPRPEKPNANGGSFSVRDILKTLLSYSGFLLRAKGDVETASIMMKKAVELAPNDGKVLSQYAHFLSKEGGQFEKADALFRRALRCSGDDARTSLWYATLLRKAGRLVEAEDMFLATLQNSANDSSIEPMAICNYATFLFKQKKETEQARRMFYLGLKRFPTHKGLRKNYQNILRDYPPPHGVRPIADH